MVRVQRRRTVVLMGEHLIRETNAEFTVSTAAPKEDARLEWQAPQWWRIEAGSAEDNPGTGGDTNGRLS